MSKMIDLTNQKFNYWTVLKRVENNSRGETMWLCQCQCGKQKIVNGYSLRKGTSKSCGCLQKKIASQNTFKDLTNKKFGHLLVLKFFKKDKNKKSIWECQCDCDGKTIIYVRSADLLSGKTQSCGCIKSKGEEKIAKILKQNNIPFEKEKTFNSCRYPDTNSLARFDFYVNNNYLIEFDGIQHFQPSYDILQSGAFNLTKKHDEFKNQWCKENNIPLIRINYSQLKNLTMEDLKL